MTEDLIIAAAIGIMLDLAIGDPPGMPHIVRWIGFLTSCGERLSVACFKRSIAAGLILWLLVFGSIALCYGLLSFGLSSIHPWLGILLDGLVVFQCIAFKDLVGHVRRVREALDEDLSLARERVSQIVGRDTDRMDQSAVCRAAIESGSENLSDSVVAPLFWLFLLGPIGLLAYRVTNTQDAMIGHRTPRYERVGKFAARLDDALNFVPARICSAAILPVTKLQAWGSLGPDAGKHPSLNAGWPEAAMARRLGVVIGGKMYANGELVETAEMNIGAPQPKPEDIERCIRAMGQAYAKVMLLYLFLVLAWMAL